MLANFYQKNIIEKPRLIFALLLACLIGFGYYAKNFRLDASSETLLIEGDPDLKYLNEITERYGSRDFLIITYTPNEKMVSSNSIRSKNINVVGESWRAICAIPVFSQASSLTKQISLNFKKNKTRH